jgi:hypothetical protein
MIRSPVDQSGLFLTEVMYLFIPLVSRHVCNDA